MAAPITVTSKDAQRIAWAFNDLVSPKGLARIFRKAVNEAGSGARKETRAIGPALFGTSAAALQVKGKAASPGSTWPEYKLSMAQRIPISRLKASHRKVTRRGSRRELTLDLPRAKPIVFRAIKREGRAFKLLKAGPLPERYVGGVYTGAKTAFSESGIPELQAVRKKAEKTLSGSVARLINAHLEKRR